MRVNIHDIVLIVRTLFRILLVVFVLQSTWAVAAQYCQHEENPKVDHIGHHTHKHNSQSTDNVDSEKSSDSSKSLFDSDCAFCHLSSIKSIVSDLTVIAVEVTALGMYDISYNYPAVVPQKPERPKWNFAA